MKFCRTCGAEIKPGKLFCNNCGTQLSTTNGDEKPVPTLTRQEASNERPKGNHEKQSRKKPKKIWIGLISILFLLLLAGCGYGYLYVQKESSPVKTVEEFTTALKSQDASSLSKLVKLSGSYESISISNWEKLLQDLHQDQEALDTVFLNIRDQEKAMQKSIPFKGTPFVFELEELEEKKWWVIKQFAVVLRPVSMEIQADELAEVTLNDKMLSPTGEATRTFDSLLPGAYVLKVTKEGAFGEFEKVEHVTIWQSPENPLSLIFNEHYVKILSSKKGADLFVNGKLYGKFTEESMEIGPLSDEQTITLQARYTYPSRDVLTEEVIAAGSDTIEFKIPDEPETVAEKEDEETKEEEAEQDTSPESDTAALRPDVLNAIYDYNTSYIEAITSLDTSVLRSAKGSQLKEATDIVVDLRKRNVYYVGHLVDMTFDGTTFKVEQSGENFKASVSVVETYMSGWKDPKAQSNPALKQKKYYYMYYCEYDSTLGKWFVTGNKELKGLNVGEAVRY
ncbi:putative membrane protein YvbJ [Bacillus tianshenii]|uniref:Membrane protein YvbJ n=1 Tax=Sutcliffiella tianshenii TaxID=1463404 RepID=A0ABS2NYZ8_9BACI|nr:zinc-ribbon domain-containing protein [Bacillus tianshenii]MBM7619618.1 putative membrane protein YvbJ [Bacillus tianshenii]